MKEKNRKPIASYIKLPQFTTMNVIDGQAGVIIYSSLICYSLTIDNILNIIVLLILAGVAIATLTGDNGLLSKAGQAKNTSEKAGEKERIQMEVAGAYDTRGRLDATKIVENIEKNIGETAEATSNSFPVKVTYNNGHKYQVASDGSIMISVNAGDTAPSDSNAVYSSGDFTAIIPAGFTVSDKTGESSIENGLVVRDGSKNEWVWIPVSPEELALMYTENNTGWKMLGTTLPEVFTKYKTLGTTLGSRTLNRTDPGTTADPYYREPDVLSSYDTNADYRKAAGFVEADGTTASSLETMATKLKDDYKDMIESVKKNGGFYIGRYELGKDSSNNPQVKAGTVMNDTDWYNLYKACKFFSNGNVESRMIWGCQWDQICRFIKGNGANTIIDDSRLYGNYKNSSDDATTNSGASNFNNTTGQLNSAWKIKNIYDIAGNCWEWTQEACDTFIRSLRGRKLQSRWFFLLSFLPLRHQREQLLLLTTVTVPFLHAPYFM